MRRRPLLSPTVFFPLCALLPTFAGCDAKSPGEQRAAYTNCIAAETSSLRAASLAVEAPKGPFAANLVATDGPRVSELLRDSIKASMRRTLDEARITQVASLRCEALRPEERDEDGVMYSNDAPTAGESSKGGASQVSTTNNQVAGVDEADFVKNDTKYIYVASGSSFRIIEAWPATSAHEIANLPIKGEAKKLFVEGNRALVYSSTPSAKGTAGNQYGGWGGYSAGECTYGLNGCVPTGDGTETEITIFDITNRAQPALVRSLHSSSSFVAARRIGNAVHTVLGEPPPADTAWDRSPDYGSGPMTESAVNVAYGTLIEKNTHAIDAITIGAVLPKWTDSAGQAPELALFQSSMPDGSAFTSLLSIDLTGEANPKVASIISRPGWIYASADALYMAVPHQQISGWGWYDGRSESELSTIHKFAIGTTPGVTAYVGTGIVEGRVLNQFAMDEKDGYLRVATTTGHLPDPAAHNTLSVLEDSAGALGVVGKIDQIAPGEDIRSVRFDGERGFVVTFKKTDPLFVFDLANPRAPKTLGELKIPGFSTYMHMMDATHLLTIGYDAADQGDFAYFTGIMLQIFDVTNPADPKLTHKEVIGTRGSSSEAATNHLAFNYFAPKNLLALPMTVCEGGDTNGSFGQNMTFSGLMVYDTTVSTGFALRGKVAHPNSSVSGEPANDLGYYNAACSNWWSNASSEVKRSIIMDDYVFSISSSRIKVNQLDNLSADIRELSLR